jgi:hypothetical protein
MSPNTDIWWTIKTDLIFKANDFISSKYKVVDKIVPVKSTPLPKTGEYKKVILGAPFKNDTAFVYPAYQHDEPGNWNYLIDYFPDGLFVGYYDDSVTIVFLGRFKNNTPDGLIHLYWKNGRIMATRSYADGRENGPYTIHNEMGNIVEQGAYLNWKVEGEYYQWYDNGKPKMRGAYTNGKKEGSWIYWKENTTEIDTLNYKSDVLINIEPVNKK